MATPIPPVAIYPPRCRPSRTTPTLSSSLTQNSFPSMSEPSSGPIYTFVIAQQALYDTLTPIQMRPLAKTDYTRSHLLLSSPSCPHRRVWSRRGGILNGLWQAALLSVHLLHPRHNPQTHRPDRRRRLRLCRAKVRQSLVRALRKVSHIEDVAVNKSMQGRKLGLRVIYITGTYGD